MWFEIWKDIEGYEGCYAVNNLGSVKSLARIKKRGKYGDYLTKEKILKQIQTRYGYMVVGLCKSGKTSQIFVHRLVANAFIEKKSGKEYVNHRNGVKHDNQVENLEWVNAKENAEHAAANKLYRPLFGDKNPMFGKVGSLNVNSKKVVMVDVNTGMILEQYDCIRDAARTRNVNSANITMVCKGERETCGGYKWAYLN